MAESCSKMIYLVSGPLGVGKSTTSKRLAGLIPHSVLIEGDHFLHMFEGEPHPSWEDRVRLSWINNVAVTRNFILEGLHVVIDFVVEEELDWFCGRLSDLDVEIRYVVLRADENTIKERLTKRGDPDSLARSLFLLRKFENSSDHQPYLYDTTNKQTDEVAQYVLQHAKKVGSKL